jgi:hypothetical protein
MSYKQLTMKERYQIEALIKEGVKLKLLLKLGDNLYCLHLSKVSRVTEMISPTCSQKLLDPVETRSAQCV